MGKIGGVLGVLIVDMAGVSAEVFLGSMMVHREGLTSDWVLRDLLH